MFEMGTYSIGEGCDNLRSYVIKSYLVYMYSSDIPIIKYMYNLSLIKKSLKRHKRNKLVSETRVLSLVSIYLVYMLPTEHRVVQNKWKF